MKRLLLSACAMAELAVWKFLTFRLHRAAPFWSKAAIRMNHLRGVVR